MLAAGCGGSSTPRLARADAAPLVTLLHRIAAEGSCAQARDIRTLQRSATRLVDRHRVPSALQPVFLRGVSALAAQTPPCLPAVPPVAVASPPPDRSHGHGHDKHGHDHGHAHGGDG